MGTVRPIDDRPQSEAQVGPVQLGVVAFYLGSMLSAGGDCELSVTFLYSCENGFGEI